jgi:hypothetical protein
MQAKIRNLNFYNKVILNTILTTLQGGFLLLLGYGTPTVYKKHGVGRLCFEHGRYSYTIIGMVY